ncbi:MAG: hypothetical protein PHC99_10250, partial [Methylococcales bacterium]|nr:hypothetical protein [Methylococcales bacterium]
PAPVAVLPTPENVVVPATMQPAQPVAVMPPPALPTPVVPPVSAPVVVPPKPVAPVAQVAPVAIDNYFGIPQELYYYAAGGVGSLLLGILGLLRLREQRKKPKEVPVVETPAVVNETAESEEQTETVAQAVPAQDSTDAMFSDEEFDMSNIDESLFENAAAGFADMVTSDDAQKRSVDDVLYKADVYCTYGNVQEAEKLLRTEFFKQPTAHDYALRLLKLYQTQDNKVEFKDFVFELVRLGKKDLPDFWANVSDIAAEFYPEALFFMPPPAIPDSTAISTNDMFLNVKVEEDFDNDLDFDSMSFDDVDEKEMTFGESMKEETGTTETDMFTQSLEFEFNTPKAEPELESGGFTLGDSFDFDFTKPEPTAEETIEEQTLDFNFADFAIEEKSTPETITDESALEFSFGDFSLEEPVKTESVEELDFSHFAVEEPVKTDVVEELDFGGFAFEEPVKTEVAEELDFSHFTVEEPVQTEAVEELDFSHFAVEEPVKTEVVEELDFSHFAVEEPVKTEAVEELDFGSFALEEPVKTEVAEELDFSHFAVEEPVKIEAVEELDFGSFALEEPVKTEVVEELDFGSFALEEPVKTEVAEKLDFSHFAVEEPVKTEAVEELDFSSFTVEEAVKTEAVEELDFGSFALEEPVKTEVVEELDFSGLTVAQSLDALTEKTDVEEADFNFTDFSEPKVFENDTQSIAQNETELDFSGFAIPEEESEETDVLEGLDLGSFVVIETPEIHVDIEPTVESEKTFREKFDENESALDLAIKNFKIDEPEDVVTVVEIPKIVEPESVFVTEKPFVEPRAKKPLDFDTVNELVEKRINETYIELAKVHAKEDVHIEYLDMSDSQFADSLASEVLKKCQIKEQLCRQKITQEVLSKLS